MLLRVRGQSEKAMFCVISLGDVVPVPGVKESWGQCEQSRPARFRRQVWLKDSKVADGCQVEL